MITGKESAVSFIRERLGCSCAPEVLSVIVSEGRSDPDVLFDIMKTLSPILWGSSDQVLFVGRRLLVVTASPEGPLEIPVLLKGCRDLRDRLGANRVRLAVPPGCLEGHSPKQLLEGFDERVHLHVL